MFVLAKGTFDFEAFTLLPERQENSRLVVDYEIVNYQMFGLQRKRRPPKIGG